ncbi:MAG: ATP12 family protein [Rhodopila sp.]|nr:ATP12 family protein [Rhodopila sp.]
MKRFWDHADVAPAPRGWQVLLDGRPMRVPGGGPLTLETEPLARAVAAEWQAAGGGRGGETSFADLKLTRIAGTGQERIAPNPEPVVLEIARYAETDLLCYRAPGQSALARRQREQWQPWLDWVERRHGARLLEAEGVTYVAQPAQALATLAGAVALHGAQALAALGVAVPALGSLVLGLALAEGELDAATAHALSILDETFQEEMWGADAEALSRRALVADDIVVAARVLALLRP